MFKSLAVVCLLIPLLASVGFAQYFESDGECNPYIFENLDSKTNNTTPVCAMINANISFTYKYNDQNNHVTMWETLPCNVTALVASCNSTVTTATLEWDDFAIEFKFNAKAKNQWSMGNFTVIIYNIPGSPVSGSHSGPFGANLDYQRSFQCNANQSYTMSSNNSKVTINMTTANLQVQAFQFKVKEQFGTRYQCDADITGSKIVPIAVGAALAGLVVIVLIAYIIGRLRSKRKSAYESLS